MRAGREAPQLKMGRTQPVCALGMRQHVQHACSIARVTHAGERAFDVWIWPTVQAKLLMSAAPVDDSNGPITQEHVELLAVLQKHSDILTH